MMKSMKESERQFSYERVAGEIAELIRAGAYRPGSRLPSVRRMAQSWQVSVTTVTSAYYLLEARGWIEARPRSGYFVRSAPYSALPEPEVSTPTPDPMHVSVRQLVTMVQTDTQNPHLIQMGAANPNPGLMGTEKLNRVMWSVARRAGEASGMYDLVPGYEPFRVQLAQRAATYGCSLSPNDILTTVGCTEAISVCLQAVCRPGDTVAIESPICFDTLQWLEVRGLKALEIPTHPRDGISLDALRFALQHHAVRACLVISNFNNPLGSCIPEENKKELVQLLAGYDIPLIENDIFGDIHFAERRPTVAKAFDRKGLVMLCSSFSKTMGPGYRLGWTAPGRFKDTVDWIKYSSTLTTPTLPQMAMTDFLSSGAYERHVRRVRRAYADSVAAASRAVERYFPPGTRSTRPAGGFVLWIQAPEGVDTLQLYREALKAGIAITPGRVFSATDQYRNYFRLNAANWSVKAERAVERLGELVDSLARQRL